MGGGRAEWSDPRGNEGTRVALGRRVRAGVWGPTGPPLTPSHCAPALPQSVWVKTGALQWWCDWKPHKWVDVHVALEQLTGNDGAQDSILFVYYVVHEEKKVGGASWRGGEVGGLSRGGGRWGGGAVFKGGASREGIGWPHPRQWGQVCAGPRVPDEEAGSGGRVNLPPGLEFEPNQSGSKHQQGHSGFCSGASPPQ